MASGALEPRKAARAGYTVILVIVLVVLGAVLTTPIAGRGSVVINEVMTSNRCTIEDEDGDYPDWVELFNRGTGSVNLEGYWLSDNADEPFKWQLPAVELPPGGFLVVFASGKNRADPRASYLHTSFRLSAGGDTLLLIHPEGHVVDRVTTGAMPSNVSYGRLPDRPDQWALFLDATPGALNEAEPHGQVTNMPGVDHSPVVVNELLTSNRTSIVDEDGDLSDWIELHNAGDTPVDLEGYWLSDKEDNAFKWRFPAVSIEPGGYLLVFASGKNRRDPGEVYLHTNFSLNDTDDVLVFSTPRGHVIDRVRIRNQVRNLSFGRAEDNPGTWLYFPRPTPGEPNYTQGFESMGSTPGSWLRITEAMAVNLSTVADEDGDYPDWIEIHNAGPVPVDLDGYGLSDRDDDPFRWEFPALTIDPGEYLLVFASGKDRWHEGDPVHTSFKIKATGETIVLTHPSGTLVDTMHTGKLSPDVSVGRPAGDSAGRFFFTEPTPGGPNDGAAYSGYALEPALSHRGGFHDRPFPLEVQTPSPGAVVRYTLDGSDPTPGSPLYTEPVLISATTTFRARSFESGKLPSPAVNRTFFVGDTHTLTVMSVMMDPADLWDPVHGMHVLGPGASDTFPYRGANFWLDIEKPIHFELYEPGGTLGIGFDAGIKIGGAFSRAMDQKIFNVFARSQYGFNEISYPFFPRKDLTTFKAITLRSSGQDAVYTKIRDIMMSSLLEDTGVDYQDHRQAILYLNGEYWGVYNLRERINRHFIAGNHGLDPDHIDLLQGNWKVRAGSADDYLDLRSFVIDNDLSIPENYAYVKTRMDVTNYIDYQIAIVYFAQYDNGNIRYWREQGPDGKWRWIMFDLDWAFWPTHVTYNTLPHIAHPEGTGINRLFCSALTVGLMENQSFRDEFVERFAHHLNNTFEVERVLARIDELAASIEPEMPRHFERWGGSMETWYEHVEDLRDFARRRTGFLMRHVQTWFNLSDSDMQVFDAWGGR